MFRLQTWHAKICFGLLCASNLCLVVLIRLLLLLALAKFWVQSGVVEFSHEIPSISLNSFGESSSCKLTPQLSVGPSKFTLFEWNLPVF